MINNSTTKRNIKIFIIFIYEINHTIPSNYFLPLHNSNSNKSNINRATQKPVVVALGASLAVSVSSKDICRVSSCVLIMSISCLLNFLNPPAKV